MTVQLRPYQLAAIENTRRALRSGKRRVLICAPTGSGKTLTSGSIILGAHAKGSRVLFVAHRRELVDQSVLALARLGLSAIGVIRAGDKRKDPSQPIQVASIQTLARRAHLDPPPHLVFIDECHRAASASYQSALYEAYPEATIIGLSATPCRTDGKPLGGPFDMMIPVARYSELIAGGFICEPIVYSTPVVADLSGVRTSGGDYNQEDLEAAVNRGALIGNIGLEWQKRSGGRRTVVFAVSVAHSLAIVDMFKRRGVCAEHLDGNTPEAERSAILARLDSGETQLVSNCNVLTEGWDQPSVKCLVLARPTKSLALYMQAAGRSLRPWNGVTPVILDHGGNVDRHGLPHEDREWSLDAKPKRGSGAPPVKACPTCFAFIAAGSKVCPHCGHTFESRTLDPSPAKEPVIVDLALRTLDGDDAKLAFYRALHRKCRERGWKYGAAIHRFEERFGGPPPAAWIRALKSDFAADVEWKGRVKERRRETEAADRAAI
jgi:superfamily II DNA or RNA helicase